MNDKTIGQRIKAARQRAGLSQSELADRMGRPYQSIGQWERDMSSPKFSSLEEVANALGISIEELICEVKSGSEDSKHSSAPLSVEQLPSDSLQKFFYTILQDVSDDLKSHDIEQYEIWESSLRPTLEKKIGEEIQKLKPEYVKKKNDLDELVNIDHAIANGVESLLSLILPSSELSESEMLRYFTSESLRTLADKEGIDNILFMFGQFVYLRKSTRRSTK